ncbi:GIP [Symbiodinium sp. CCMP2592]|nr:GIP [Symbiodinium sp. CCMP2592]
MAAPPTEPGSSSQQVMTAQVTEATPLSRGVGHSTLEGELRGPDYGGQQSMPPQLPNGVTRASPTSSMRTVDGIESLPYSPAVDSSTRPGQAFFQEAWPAQPRDPDVGSSESRSGEGVPAAFRWVHRLGDFLRSHSAMETFTTMTRQQLVSPANGGGGFVLQQQRVQRTTSPTASRSGRQLDGSATDQGGGLPLPVEESPPLFGRAAARRMEEWAAQAPLLHGSSSRPALQDDVSSNSIPREVVEEEVRRQVQLALQSHQQGMMDLREENQRLRDRLSSTPTVSYLKALGLIRQSMEYQAVIGPLQPVAQYQKAIGLILQIMEYQAVIGPLQPVAQYQKAIGLILQIMEYQAVIGPLQPVAQYQKAIGLILQIMEYQAVIGPLQTINQYLKALGLILQIMEYQAVIGPLQQSARSSEEHLHRSSERAAQELERRSKAKVGTESNTWCPTIAEGLSDGDIGGVRPTEAAYRPSPTVEGVTFGDYGLGYPPGLGAQPPRAPREELVDRGGVQGSTPTEEPKETERGATAPNPLDVLITGMSQLQQVLLKQKGETMDIEPKAVQELAKLPEYTPESGATDFQDYLYLAEQQIGSLASGAGDWWQRTLSVAQKAYAEYQSLSPMKRLSVQVTLPADLREDKYKRLERKVASLMLGSLPRGVRDELVAHRVQGVHQILFRLMVVFQPGGAQDRAQLLRQLDVNESSAGPAEAVIAIRRWYRLLQRASDLNIALPDESLQVRSLSNIVKKTADQYADFKFRVALAKTELQIDSRPSQSNVMRFLQHLLAELEQLGGGSRRGPATTSSTTTAGSGATAPAGSSTTLKGMQQSVEDAKGKGKATPPAPKKACQWFGTDAGCRNGKSCGFTHSWQGLNRTERCLLCGSKQHRAKDCATKDNPPSPTRAPPPPPKATAAALSTTSSTTAVSGTPAAKAAAVPPIVVPDSATPIGSATSNGNKIDAAKMTEILTETNRMLKTLTEQQVSEQSTTAPPTDPLVLIQQQLDEVRRMKVIQVKGPESSTAPFSSAVAWYEARLSASTCAQPSAAEEGEALLDSGASHAYRPALLPQDATTTKTVTVTLATGEERNLAQTGGGTLLGEEGSEAIVPMGQLVRLLGCRISWTPSKLTVIHPVHGRLQVRLRGQCPVMPVSQAMTLISELEEARIKEFEKTVADLRSQVRVLRERGREDWSWQRHLKSFCEEGDRTSMAGFLHTCPVFAALPPEVLLGLPEAVPPTLKDGWKMLKGLPWSRAKRKVLFQSDSWVVHLCAGDNRSWEAKEQQSMRRAMWSSSLTGSDVIVDVDIADSKHMDLLQQGAVFRVLAWAAMHGKIKAVVGGPPRHGFPSAEKEVNYTPHQLKEMKLAVRLLSLWYIAEAGRCEAWKKGALKQMPLKPHVGLMLEHPAAQEGQRSIFDHLLWKSFAEEELMGEVKIVMNGRKTVLGSNLNLWHLEGASFGALTPGTPGCSVWPMELVAHVAGALRSWAGLRHREGLLASLTRRLQSPEDAKGGLAKFDVGEWKLHLQRDHLPYRRDCRVCIERASGKPHRKVTHPSAYSLAVDAAGPFRVRGAGGYKYLMVGCYRFPKMAGIGEKKEPAVPDGEIAPGPDDGGDWISDGDPVVPGIGDPMEEGMADVGLEEAKPEEEHSLDKEVEALRELAKPLEFSSVYLARPMKSRSKADALRAVQELYVQLRSQGFPVCKLHMDRARELQTDALEAWAAARDIDVTRTQGSDPPANGTAERAVGYLKSRMRVLLGQAKQLGDVDDETLRSWWPFAAETAVAQHQALVFQRKLPTVARFGSKVFTKRKGYGVGGRFDLQPRWLSATYLGPARSVPGGHLVFTDEGNLWYTTHIRQFEDPPAEDEAYEAEADEPVPPARRVRRKSSIVDLAGGVGLMPGMSGEPLGDGAAKAGLKSIVKVAEQSTSSSSDEVASEAMVLDGFEVPSEFSQKVKGDGDQSDLAAEFLRDGRFTMEDCLRVLENERFLKTRKQRASAWKDNEAPQVHTTLGAYQRGPWSGVTTATTRHRSLTEYLVALYQHHCGPGVTFTSMTVARDLCTDAHRDKFNLRNSKNYVITVGNFSGGGIWQEGVCDGSPQVSIETEGGKVVNGFVSPVHNRVVNVDPKKLHKTMPWEGGPKWTIIAHTVGYHGKLSEDHRGCLRDLGFVLPSNPELKVMKTPDVQVREGGGEASLDIPGQFPPSDDPEEELWTRIWTRRLLDEEEVLAAAVPSKWSEDFKGVSEANMKVAEEYDQLERLCKDRYDVEGWLTLCKLAARVVYTVPLEEVKQFIGRWTEAIVKEADALIKAKALVPLSQEEQRALEASGKLVILPAKGVFTVKPPDQERLVGDDGQPVPPGDPSFYKRKARLVICGNFQGKQAQEDSYAGGCQTDSLRIMLVRCAVLGWFIASTDIRNAFILAPIQEEDEEEDTVYALYAPKVLVLAKVEYALRLWRVDRALYGFRRSPRLWGRFRDKRLRSAKIEFEGGYIYLSQHKADENIWSVKVVSAEGEEKVRAYINVYVDDILYIGEVPVIEAVQRWLTSEWKASELSWASEKVDIRFLGLEIGRTKCGGVRIHQGGYIDELLRHHNMTEARGYLTPCPQEWLLGEAECPEEEHPLETLRRAQTLTGEVLWLSGKSRPDLMHAIATMSSWCLRNPSLVERIGVRVLGYLKQTRNLGLVYEPTRADHYIEGFSDASFAPSGSRSVGCSLTRYLGQPVAWRSGRQALVSLSVAEAELIEAVSTVQLAYGVASITEEIHGGPPEIVIKVDNTAAIGLCNESSGTWKTRHLKVRAFHLREAVRSKELRVEHIPGLQQLGDLGTKAFHRPRLQELLRLWGLLEPGDSSTIEVEGGHSHKARVNGTMAVLAKLVLLMGWMVQGSRASETDRGAGLEVSFPWEMYAVGGLMLVASIAVWEGVKWRLQQTISEEVARYDLDSQEVQAEAIYTHAFDTHKGPIFVGVERELYVSMEIVFIITRHVMAFGMR